MTAASDAPNDRALIAHEAVYAVIHGGRSIEEAVDYFGLTSAEYIEAYALHIERTRIKPLEEMAAARAERRR